MSKDELQASKIAKWAEEDLVVAREFAKDATPEQAAQARQMARDAKKRRTRASRRAGKAHIREFESSTDF